MGHKWGIQKLETQPSQFREKSRLYGCERLSLLARAAGHTLPVHRLLNLNLNPGTAKRMQRCSDGVGGTHGAEGGSRTTRS